MDTRTNTNVAMGLKKGSALTPALQAAIQSILETPGNPRNPWSTGAWANQPSLKRRSASGVPAANNTRKSGQEKVL